MRKHTYRQTDVNDIDWNLIRAKAENRELHFCVDVAKEKFVGLLITGDGEIIRLLKWKHPQDTAGGMWRKVKSSTAASCLIWRKL